MSKINELLKKTELFERLALRNDRKGFLESLAQGYSGDLATDPNMTPNPNAVLYSAQADGDGLTPAERAKLLPKVPQDVQRKLNELLVSSGKINPIAVDGILGNSTRHALNAFRKAYNVPAAATDQQVFDQVITAHKLESSRSSSSTTNAPVSTPASLTPTNPVFDTLNQPGPVTASDRNKAALKKIDAILKMVKKYQ